VSGRHCQPSPGLVAEPKQPWNRRPKNYALWTPGRAWPPSRPVLRNGRDGGQALCTTEPERSTDERSSSAPGLPASRARPNARTRSPMQPHRRRTPVRPMLRNGRTGARLARARKPTNDSSSLRSELSNARRPAGPPRLSPQPSLRRARFGLPVHSTGSFRALYDARLAARRSRSSVRSSLSA